MSTITEERQEAIRQFVMGHRLGSELGSKEETCSIGAINLALGGALSDKIPKCMSLVIGRWIIGVQDDMPDAMRNDFAWKALLPLAAGTGREPALEQRRLAIILDWMWTKILPSVQPIADKYGFAVEWKAMLLERTEAAADAAETAARRVAEAAETAEEAAAADAAGSAARAAAAAETAEEAVWRVRWRVGLAAADAAGAPLAAWRAGLAAAWAARVGVTPAAWAAAERAGLDASWAAWAAFAPEELLRQLIELSAETRAAL